MKNFDIIGFIIMCILFVYCISNPSWFAIFICAIIYVSLYVPQIRMWINEKFK